MKTDEMKKTVARLCIACVALVALNSISGLANAQRKPVSEWKWVDDNIAENCQHVVLTSPSMNRKVGYSIYLPPSYQETEKHYPVVYYLHGAGGSESSSREFSWAVEKGIKEGLIQEMIFVFPNSGHFSGYRDWEDGSVKAETWIIDELIPHVDSTYRTISTREGRALAGWSMGGGGSLRFLMKYPDRFCSAAAISAAVGLGRVDATDTAEANLRKNVDKIRNRCSIWMAIGEQDYLRPKLEPFVSSLTELNVGHSFTVLTGVEHNLGKMSSVFYRDILQFLNQGFEVSSSEERSVVVRSIRDAPYKQDPATEYEQERCKLDWYLPVGKKNFPTIVWFHGGSIKNGQKAGDNEVKIAARFARDGIGFVSVNYRLSPQVKYPAYIEDAAAAVAYVRKHVKEHGGNENQVYVSGHSAGGYLTSMVGMNPDYLKAFRLTPQDLAGFMPIAGQTITHSTVRSERGIPRTRPIIDEAAPAFYASADAPPFLCIAGSRDLPARAEENRYFTAVMKAAGHKDIQYLEIEGRDHGSVAMKMMEPDDVVAQKLMDFIAEHSKP